MRFESDQLTTQSGLVKQPFRPDLCPRHGSESQRPGPQDRHAGIVTETRTNYNLFFVPALRREWRVPASRDQADVESVAASDHVGLTPQRSP